MLPPIPIYQLVNNPEGFRQELVRFGYEEIVNEDHQLPGIEERNHFLIDRYPTYSDIVVVVPRCREKNGNMPFIHFTVMEGRLTACWIQGEGILHGIELDDPENKWMTCSPLTFQVLIDNALNPENPWRPLEWL